MNFRENVDAILHYRSYDRMPVVAFGFWKETVWKWMNDGFVSREIGEGFQQTGNSGPSHRALMDEIGFDFDWGACIGSHVLLSPAFEQKELERCADGSRIIRNEEGLICRVKPGLTSIPGEIGTSLTDRTVWEEEYLPRLKMSADRVAFDTLEKLPPKEERNYPLGLGLGSLLGHMRNMLGVEQLSYLYVDDEDLYREIVDTLCGLCYECAKAALETGVQLDYAHYWEDICFKNGPLVSPKVFAELIGPWYKKITKLVNAHGIDIISVDCDGWIDLLLPIWLENGVNTMFPIEVGTWNASIGPWREKYGRDLRGVGGMNKNVFARDKAAVEAEVERLKPLIDLGGYIPCPDHRIAPDAKFELVQYYCELMRK